MRDRLYIGSFYASGTNQIEAQVLVATFVNVEVRYHNTLTCGNAGIFMVVNPVKPVSYMYVKTLAYIMSGYTV